MPRLKTELIEKIRALRKDGFSFNEISLKLGLSKSTIHYHSFDVPLTSAKLQRLENLVAESQRKFVSKFSHVQQIKDSFLTATKVRMLGHLFFDGSVLKYGSIRKFCYTNASKASVENFINLVNEVYGLESRKIYSRKGVNVMIYQVEFGSKAAYENLALISSSFSTSEGVGVPKEIKNSCNNEIQAEFLKAFWSDEGSISARGNLTGSSKSRQMIIDLMEMHKSMGIDCTSYVDKITGVSVLRVRKQSLKDFSKKLGFGFGIVSKGHYVGKTKQEVLEEILNKCRREDLNLRQTAYETVTLPG